MPDVEHDESIGAAHPEPVDADQAVPRRGLHDWLLDTWARACSRLQYLVPFVLAPLGGLAGWSYGDLRSAIVGAIAGTLLAALVMPLLRRALYLVGATPLALLSRLRRRPVLTILLLLAAVMFAFEIWRSVA